MPAIIYTYMVPCCCCCGIMFDAREKFEGGADEGAELTDGRWVCSADCWELVTADAET